MRAFTSEQRAMLRSEAVSANLLLTFYLDEGIFRFSDDVVDLYNGSHTYIGANALAGQVEIKSGKDLAAESVTIRCDGQRMTEAGIEDPAKVLSEMLDYLHQQRRVDMALGLRYPDQRQINLTIPLLAAKINNCVLVDPSIDQESEEQISGYLDINLDALASRYSRATFRTRSHADQHEIDPDDDFFSFTQDASNAEQTIYWGKASPYASSGAVFAGGVGGANWLDLRLGPNVVVKRY